MERVKGGGDYCRVPDEVVAAQLVEIRHLNAPSPLGKYKIQMYSHVRITKAGIGANDGLCLRITVTITSWT